MVNNINFKKIERIGVFFVLLVTLSIPSFSQVQTFKKVDLSYKDYLKLVVSGNLEYTVEKFNVDIADASIKAARIFNNPSLALDWTGNKDGHSIGDYSLAAELSKSINLVGKRGARIKAAKSERVIVNTMLADYFRNLRADATIDYLTALKQNYVYEEMRNSYLMVKELAKADSIRLSLGSIKAIDATQSKIEAGILLNDLMQTDSDRKNAFINLSIKTSVCKCDSIFFPTGRFSKPERSFMLTDLLKRALENRSDLMAAKTNIDHQKNLLSLTRRERMADIDLKVGITNSYLKGKLRGPESTEFAAGIGLPLNFSNLNKGEIKIAKYQIEQSKLQYNQIKIIIKNEVVQAYNEYKSLCNQVENYNQGLLKQTKEVLDGKVYSYKRGETSLLEVLNAQRTYNELQTSYYETLYNCYTALVELERAVGIWDIVL